MTRKATIRRGHAPEPVAISTAISLDASGPQYSCSFEYSSGGYVGLRGGTEDAAEPAAPCRIVQCPNLYSAYASACCVPLNRLVKAASVLMARRGAGDSTARMCRANAAM